MKRRSFLRFVTRGMVGAGYVAAFGLPDGAEGMKAVDIWESDFGFLPWVGRTRELTEQEIDGLLHGIVKTEWVENGQGIKITPVPQEEFYLPVRLGTLSDAHP